MAGITSVIRGCATSLTSSFFKWLRDDPVTVTEIATPHDAGLPRGSVDHVIVLDGTMSSLQPGFETNAGLAFRLLCEPGPWPRRRVYYEPGVQWKCWGDVMDVVQGRGINRQIRRAYGWLSSHYRPGDRIFLFGYSRGAYAVRSLAGLIDRMGLLHHDHATERNVTLAYRHYVSGPDSHVARVFSHAHCHPEAPIEMVGVWDTVKALGLRLPLLWMLTDRDHAFHNHHLGASIRHGFHALALHETRMAFAPVLWDCPPGWEGDIEQIWFHGAHPDIGGHIGGMVQARPLSNIPFVWIMERAQAYGMALPDGWQARYPRDVSAPMVGTWKSWGKLLLVRRRRRMALDPSERLHSTVKGAGEQIWKQAVTRAQKPVPTPPAEVARH